MPEARRNAKIVLVTGPSGAGRATAINVLEDLGYETIDNIPLRIVPRLFEAGEIDRPLALGIDVRNRDFSVSGLLDLYHQLQAQTDGGTTLFYLNCSATVLLRRYSETRRRHPLTPENSPEEGVLQELAVLEPVEAQADIVIDTSELSPHDLKAEMHQWFADSAGQKLSVSLQSFSYKRGIPQGVDMVFDCRFLKNPHWDAALRSKTGLDPAVQCYVEEDPRLAPFTTHITGMLSFLLPEFETEGKSHVSVGIGCTGGKHRSVVVTQRVARTLAHSGWRVSTTHKELSRLKREHAGVEASEVGRADK